jgi:hypothetical protein
VFCVRCGATMVLRNGEFYCEPGRMGYSQALLAEVERGMVSMAPIGGHPIHPTALHCARCGAAMRRHKQTDLGAQCPSCGFVLSNGAGYTLLEHHPHA